MTGKRITLLPLVFLLAAMLAFVVAGCGDKTTDPSSSSTEPATTASSGTSSSQPAETTAGAQAFDGEVVIGSIASLTGASALSGQEQAWAEDRAVADINANGGLDIGGKKMELKIVRADDRSEATEAAAAMEKLIKVEGLKIIVGTQVTPLNLAAAQIAEKYQVLFTTTHTFTDWVQEKGYKWTADLFFTPAANAETPLQMVELMPEAERPKIWGILTEDNQDGQGLGGGFKAMAEKHGVNLAVYQTFTPGSKDYSAAILKFREANVDALVAFVNPSDGITFTKQMKEANYSPKYMMGWKGFWPSEFTNGLGPDSDYISYDGFWSEDFPYPGSKELGEAYKAEHNGIDSVSIGLLYAKIQCLAQAIEAAGSTDPAAVRDALFGGTFKDTVMGDIQYGEDGVSNIPSLGFQWIGGKRVLIFPENLATGTLQWFVPWDQR